MVARGTAFRGAFCTLRGIGALNSHRTGMIMSTSHGADGKVPAAKVTLSPAEPPAHHSSSSQQRSSSSAAAPAAAEAQRRAAEPF